jgi:hypothetical protein
MNTTAVTPAKNRDQSAADDAELAEGDKGVRVLPRVVVFQGMLDRVVRAKDDPDGTPTAWPSSSATS